MRMWSVKQIAMALLVTFSLSSLASEKTIKLNDLDYFETRGLNVLVYSNWYNGLFSDSKISGVEFIHHGIRTVTNGDVRLNATPEQWDPIPAFIERKIDRDENSIEAFLHYPDYGFAFSVKVVSLDDHFTLSVHLPKKLPQALEGVAGFNLEFLPTAYFHKSFIADNQFGAFPIYPSGPKEQNGIQAPTPLASGHHLVLAPEDANRRVSIESKDVELALYDGRSKAQNGWFVVRSLLPANKTGKVLEWKLSASTQENWLRDPVIAHSQVGYHPNQNKVAVIELDKHAQLGAKASLYKVNKSGEKTLVASSLPEFWGQYKRYQYAKFDFSQVTESGIYQLQYDNVITAPFKIAKDVYEQAWHPTLDVFFPVQMDHVLVNEAYRVWHGASHLDDALQAPVNHEHFDLYAQGPTTDSPYQPGEHVPGLNIGGWYDAGDYDIRTQTQYRAVQGLVEVWEQFKPLRDTTLVDYDRKYVDLHVPDGKPDILQQIEHGALALLAQHRAFGRAINGIIVPDISQYTHLGDGLTMTDNLIYNPDMSPLESDGKQSGVFDDRWVFTSRSSAVNYGSIAALTATSRALAEHNPELAKEAQDTALAAWNEEQSHPPFTFRHGNTTGGPLEAEKLKAAAELLITTNSSEFAQAVNDLWPEIEENFAMHIGILVRILPLMDEAFQGKIKNLAQTYIKQLETPENPFGVTITEGGWAGNGFIIRQAINHYYLHKAFPELVSPEAVFSGLNYLYGTHPDSDISFVSNVGTRSKQVAYGMNRADFSFISGGIVPGVLILKPDLPENKEDWPFLWGENEYVINLGASYIMLVHATNDLVNRAK
ncbi:glycoside hydrolase family 9 protein [Glaciecola sp. 1036]|uniref:glycoside hydrolase family 9 protein n=1 Tax=Alteromonadaceae TaxID=72275 RepID=UPI003CFC9AA7